MIRSNSNLMIQNQKQPHFVLVPHLAQGHMIPMLDIASIIAGRGVLVSFITTPVNTARIKSTINQAKQAEMPVRFIDLKFPCAEAGLPDGYENSDLLPYNRRLPFFRAMALLQKPLELYLSQANPAPSCIISDYCQWWTEPIARDLNIPRVIFHGPSCFYLLTMHNIRKHKLFDGLHELQAVTVPDLPARVELSRAQAPGWFYWPEWDEIRNKMMEAEASADGVVINTFTELEQEIIVMYEKAIGKRVWAIGPLSLCNNDSASKATRGNKASIDEQQLISWLDSMEPKSVIFFSLSTLAHTKPSQLMEIGCGLEASRRPFIWVMKESEWSREVEEWMLDGFEKRIKGRGLIIRGWAPQVLILTHPSVGGVVTHCGWNSIMEALSGGVPMITWPQFADQFVNERFVVQIAEVGEAVGVKLPFYYCGEEGEVMVKREELDRAVESLINGGGEAEERRKRAAEFADKATKAMEEGGSSYQNMTLFIQYVMDLERSG